MNLKKAFDRIKKKLWSPKELERPDLSDEVLIVKPDEPLKEVVAKLAGGTNLLAAYVVEGGKPIGVVVKDDVLTRAVLVGKDLATLKVSDIMSTDLVTILDEADFRGMVEEFLEKSHMSQPIVDKEGKLRGVLTIFDIAKYLFQFLK
ncbi:MAG: hypothetical protein Kow0069_02310 [Promethearchaeota archaeon]